jgi:hypothetical protein
LSPELYGIKAVILEALPDALSQVLLMQLLKPTSFGGGNRHPVTLTNVLTTSFLAIPWDFIFLLSN